MSVPGSVTRFIKDEQTMSDLGTTVAQVLSSGDTLLLYGPIGAGKTHFARAIIRELLQNPEDIPSPTYTLVQTYLAHNAEVWHADLYRLADSSELVELGLDDALNSEIVLIEWADRLPTELVSEHALQITILPSGTGRTIKFQSASSRWADLLTSLQNE